MNIKTFEKAILYDEYVSIGGGEPTIHPQFWEFIGLALGFCESIWLATNGSITSIALALARMAKRGVLSCALSQDAYHDAIDVRVVKAFTKEDQSYSWRGNDHDFREIQDVTGKEVNGGRCDFGEDRCGCAGLVCKPDGRVYACGCADAPCFGNVHTEIDIPDEWDTMDCYRKQTEKICV